MTDTPLMIHAAVGQQINFTLLNFNWHSEKMNQNGSRCTNKCGYLFDVTAESVVNICGGNQKVKPLYKSIGSQVQVLLDRKELDAQQLWLTENNYAGLISTANTNWKKLRKQSPLMKNT